MKKEGFKIAVSTVLIALAVVTCVVLIATSLATKINDATGIDDRIELPSNEKLIEYTIDNGKLYYSTRPMNKNYEPKEYQVYSNGTHITTIVESKR